MDMNAPLLDADRLAQMRRWTEAIIARGAATCRVNGVEYPVILPSGSRQYPAFWIRDAVWIVECGLVATPVVEAMVRVMALTQNGAEARTLKHGLVVPAWAVADHVLLEDGGAIYFPGGYEAGEDQGDGTYGWRAAQDACYSFIEMAYLWSRQGRNTRILLPVLDRLRRAFDSPEHDARTQLAFTTKATRAVAYSDAIIKTGFLLEGSVLRWKAARRLAVICEELGLADAEHYRQVARTIQENLVETFWRDGWLVSATEIGRQACVRGTCFALAYGALEGPHAERAARSLLAELGSICHEGCVRHLRAGEYWEQTSHIPRDQYQNGGYWPMFAGWLARALEIADPAAARAVARQLFEHIAEHREAGAPWEWILPNGFREGPQYLAGLTLPYRGFGEGYE